MILHTASPEIMGFEEISEYLARKRESAYTTSQIQVRRIISYKVLKELPGSYNHVILFFSISNLRDGPCWRPRSLSASRDNGFCRWALVYIIIMDGQVYDEISDATMSFP